MQMFAAAQGENIRYAAFRPCYVISPEEWEGAPTQQGHTVPERLADPALSAPALFNYVDARDVADFLDCSGKMDSIPNGQTFFVGAADALATEPLAELMPQFLPGSANCRRPDGHQPGILHRQGPRAARLGAPAQLADRARSPTPPATTRPLPRSSRPGPDPRRHHEIRRRTFFPVTPFTPEGDVDVDVLKEHISSRLPFGPGGVFPACGTGEFHALSIEEVRTVVTATVEAVAGQVPVVAGAGGPLGHALAAARAAEEAGADALLVLPPYLVTGPIDGLVAYIEAVAAPAACR